MTALLEIFLNLFFLIFAAFVVQKQFTQNVWRVSFTFAAGTTFDQ